LENIEKIDEIVVNDLNFIDYILDKMPNKKIVLGTVFPGKLYKGSELHKLGIERIEVMSRRNTSPDSLSVSFHLPYLSLSISRYCPVANIFNNHSPNAGIVECDRECLVLGQQKVKSKMYSEEMLLDGNRLKIESHKDKSEEEVIREVVTLIPAVDRFVFEPY